MKQEEDIERARVIRRRVRLETGRTDGVCGKVSEAIEAELGWAYRWGHLRLRDGGICWIHCWNELPDGTIVDTTADQFEERWWGDLVELPPSDPRHACYRPAPRGHLFRIVRSDGLLKMLVRLSGSGGEFEPEEEEVATAPDTADGWLELGARAVEIHSGWQLPEWIGREASLRLREATDRGEALPSRQMEFALDTADMKRRSASHGEWTSPEWRESHPIQTIRLTRNRRGIIVENA